LGGRDIAANVFTKWLFVIFSPPVMLDCGASFGTDDGSATASPKTGCYAARLARRCARSAVAVSNTYNDWFLDPAFVLLPIQTLAGQFL
jgi:hypothetical protein